MSQIIKRFQLTTLGTCLAMALITGVMTTTANASSHTAEVSAAQAAKISLKQAINIASKEASGTLVSAEFDDDDSDANGNGGVYEIEFSTNSSNYEIKVDANTGKIVKTETERLDSGDIDDYKVQQKAKINITKAISLVEKHTGGQVMEIEFKNDRDYAKHPSYYEVEVLKDQQIIELNMDANTGSIFKRKIKK